MADYDELVAETSAAAAACPKKIVGCFPATPSDPLGLVGIGPRIIYYVDEDLTEER